MQNQDSFKNRLLWRVYVIWFFRRILPLMTAQVLLFALALRIFARNVFVARVLQNVAGVAEAGYWEVLAYLIKSFLITRPITQVMVLLALGFFALILRDLGRGLRAYRTLWKKKGISAA